MLHPAHKVPQSPRIPNAATTTSRVQPVLQTSNNGMQSSSNLNPMISHRS